MMAGAFSRRKIWPLAASIWMLLSLAVAAQISKDEAVVFFPTIAQRVGDVWEADVHGWIFEVEPRKALLAVFRKSVGLDESSDVQTRAIFAERARLFLADNERDKKVSVKIGVTVHPLGTSSANGHFAATIKLGADDVKRLVDSVGRIHFRAVTATGDRREFSGTIHLMEETGITVISDIDDTIKMSHVLDKKELLANTFHRPFKTVPGMPEVYRAWAGQGVCVHYLSASPWQLYPSLAEWIQTARFPAGSFQMKDFRWKDRTAVNLFESPEEYKTPAIERLLLRFPKRRFVLVGDSGEKDPEVYGVVARKFPEQIIRILIRDVTSEESTAARYATAFRDVSADKWRIFKEPAEIKDSVK